MLLHGCCHNPTGADLDDGQWREVVDVVSRRGLIPVRRHCLPGAWAAALPRMRPGCICCSTPATKSSSSQSCDKNFGVYRDRVGSLFRQDGAALTGPSGRWTMSSRSRAKCGRCRPTMAPRRSGSCSTRRSCAPTGMPRLARCATASTASAAQIAAADPRLAYIGESIRHVLDAAGYAGAGASSCANKHAIYMADSGRFNVIGMADSCGRPLHCGRRRGDEWLRP